MSSNRVRMDKSTMPGMRPFPKEKIVPIEAMKADELRSLYLRNEEVLRTLTASSSTFVARIEANQAKIRERLTELDGMDNIQRGMRRTTIGEDAVMVVDSEPEEQELNAVKVKQQAVAAWGKSSKANMRNSKTGTMSLEEAIALEQQHNAFEQERRERAEARRIKQTMPTRNTTQGRTHSREEYEAKVWAFMNYKPTDSDMEGEDEDEDEDDPASWFHDEEDDGIKGQDIVYPDAEDLADVIRMDSSKFSYSTFYEPRDPDD